MNTFENVTLLSGNYMRLLKLVKIEINQTMRNMTTRIISLGLTTVFLLFHGAAAADETSYNAAELTQLAQNAVSKLIDEAQKDEALDISESKSKPFWEAAKQMSDSLGDAEKALAAEDNKFFEALATTVAASQQAKISVLMIQGISDPVKESVENASTLIFHLDSKYSKEAARLAAGGELTDEEIKQLEKLKQQQKEVQEKRGELEKTVAKNNEEMQKSIEEIRKKSDQIRNARNNHADFCYALFAARFMMGSLWGWHYWWGPWGYWGPGFININIVIWDSWNDYYQYDWALVEESIDAAEIIADIEDVEYLADLDDYSTEASEQWIDELEIDVDEEDLVEITQDLDAAGWDEVDTDQGMEVLEGYESNFGNSPFDQGFEMEVFDDMGGFDDFGGAFDLY